MSTSEMGHVRLGVLGAAKISGKALLQPALDTDGTSVTAIAARDVERAQAQASEFSIANVLDSYQAVIESDLVDAIYNPLPISHHHEWTIAALRAGKHVLCEKPIASNAAEAAEMVAVADECGLVLMEAYHWRHHPLAARFRGLLDEGVIGSVVEIDAGFNVAIPPDNEVRHAYELSGGALMDLGCYPLQWARLAAGTEPTVMSATMGEGRPKVDVDTIVNVEFPGSDAAQPIRGRLVTSMRAGVERDAWLTIVGTLGTMRVTNPLAPHVGNRIEVETADGVVIDEEVDGNTTYHHQLEVFRDAVLTGSPVITGGADSIATMAAIDAAYTAAGLPIRGT